MTITLKEKKENNKELVNTIPKNLLITTNDQNEINSFNWFKGCRERGFR